MTITGKEKDYKPIVKVNDKNYIISWNKKVLETEKSSLTGKKSVSEPLYTWEAYKFSHKPSLSEIKKLIHDKVNGEVSYAIENYFKWNGYSIKLTKENQMNYKMYYDLACQSNGTSLPVTVRFYKDDVAEYYTFELLDEFTDFYSKMVAHINSCLERGWKKKENFHIEDYML